MCTPRPLFPQSQGGAPCPDEMTAHAQMSFALTYAYTVDVQLISVICDKVSLKSHASLLVHCAILITVNLSFQRTWNELPKYAKYSCTAVGTQTPHTHIFEYFLSSL